MFIPVLALFNPFPYTVRLFLSFSFLFSFSASSSCSFQRENCRKGKKTLAYVRARVLFRVVGTRPATGSRISFARARSRTRNEIDACETRVRSPADFWRAQGTTTFAMQIFQLRTVGCLCVCVGLWNCVQRGYCAISPSRRLGCWDVSFRWRFGEP